MKKCSACDEMKSFDCFRARSNRPGQYQPMCIACQAVYTLEWQRANRNLVNANSARSRQKRPDYYLAKNANDRAVKLKRTPYWLSLTDRANIRLFYLAASALSKETGILFTVDHIIPLQGKM